MDGGDHRLLESDARLGEDRPQLRPENVKVRLGLPDIEDLDLTVGFKRAVEGAPFGFPPPAASSLLIAVSYFSGVKPSCTKWIPSDTGHKARTGRILSHRSTE